MSSESQSNSEHSESDRPKLLDNSVLRIGSVITVLVFVSAITVQGTRFVTTNEIQLKNIEEQIAGLEATIAQGTEDRWRRSDMIRLCREMELLNSDFSCGTID